MQAITLNCTYPYGEIIILNINTPSYSLIEKMPNGQTRTIFINNLNKLSSRTDYILLVEKRRDELLELKRPLTCRLL